MASIDPAPLHRSSVVAVDDPNLATKDANAIVVLTDWPEFRDLDWHSIAEQAPAAVVFDTRNLLDPAVLGGAGLKHLGNGVPGGF